MRIVLFGPPGAGKGTQAELLAARRGLKHITTGGIIRAAIAAGTPAGREAEPYMKEGRLVPDAVVRKLAEEAMAEQDYCGFVLDGYPRTLRQARWLTAFLHEHEAPLHVVISLQVSDEVIVERLSKRRVHRETGENYHLEVKPPPPELDPALIVQRPDDRPEAIRTRLEVYYEETAPVEAYYREQGCHARVDGVGSFEEVYARVERALEEAVPAEVPRGRQR